MPRQTLFLPSQEIWRGPESSVDPRLVRLPARLQPEWLSSPRVNPALSTAFLQYNLFPKFLLVEPPPNIRGNLIHRPVFRERVRAQETEDSRMHPSRPRHRYTDQDRPRQQVDRDDGCRIRHQSIRRIRARARRPIEGKVRWRSNGAYAWTRKVDSDDPESPGIGG